MSDDWLFDVLTKAMTIAIVGLALIVVWYLLQPLPTCPDGYVLAGGPYAGHYHCVPGVEPRRP